MDLTKLKADVRAWRWAMPDVTLMEHDLGRTLYIAALKAAVGEEWPSYNRWPVRFGDWSTLDDIHDIKLAIAQARAALQWMKAMFGVEPRIAVDHPREGSTHVR